VYGIPLAHESALYEEWKETEGEKERERERERERESARCFAHFKGTVALFLAFQK
jgi:hypothetical protein